MEMGTEAYQANVRRLQYCIFIGSGRVRLTGQIHEREGRHPDRTAVWRLRVSAAALDNLRNTSLIASTAECQKRMDGCGLKASAAAVPHQRWSGEIRLVVVCNLVQAESALH